MNLRMVCGMFVFYSLCVYVTNTLLMSSATAIVQSSGLLWWKPVAMVLFMLCSSCKVVVLKPCYVHIVQNVGYSL